MGGSWDTAQSAECVPSFELHTPGYVVHSCNTSTGQTQLDDQEVKIILGYIVGLKLAWAMGDLVSKRKCISNDPTNDICKESQDIILSEWSHIQKNVHCVTAFT